MDLLTAFVYVTLGLWFLAVIVAVVRLSERRWPRLRPLSPELYDRFVGSWDRVMSRFVHAPREVAREADALVVSLLHERGQPVEDNQLPSGVRDARRWLAREAVEGTEALRQAMLRYQTVFNRMIGGRPGEATEKRREMA